MTTALLRFVASVALSSGTLSTSRQRYDTDGIAEQRMLSMTYQDQKLRAIGRLTIIATVITVLLALALIYPESTRNIVSHLPLSRRGDEYGVWLGILATMTPICWGVNLGLIFTSPEQEVRFVEWSKRWRKTPIEFEKQKFDTADSDYRKAAWRYLLDRRQG